MTRAPLNLHTQFSEIGFLAELYFWIIYYLGIVVDKYDPGVPRHDQVHRSITDFLTVQMKELKNPKTEPLLRKSMHLLYGSLFFDIFVGNEVYKGQQNPSFSVTNFLE